MQILQVARSKGIFPAVMDVTDETSVCDTIAAAVAARGPIQICVANARIAEGQALYKTDLALWKRIMATNLDGTFLTIRECFKSMRGTDWGRVIAVASIAGGRGLKGAGAYSASKHGVIGYSLVSNKMLRWPVESAAYLSRMQWQLWFRPIAMRV